jgi:pyrroloquinoline quinone biosynthesis protein B
VTTDAELDHTLGIPLLREARSLHLYATSAVRDILEEDSRLLAVTRAFADVAVTEITPDQRTELRYRDGAASSLSVTPFVVPAGVPRFARSEQPGHTVGVSIRDAATGGSVAFVPGCGDLDAEMVSRLADTDLLLFDGTFWSDHELIGLGISDRTARQMDHIPLSGPDGSLARLSSLPGRKVYTHINNTNPILLEDSPERAAVEQAGIAVGADGMSFTV